MVGFSHGAFLAGLQGEPAMLTEAAPSMGQTAQQFLHVPLPLAEERDLRQRADSISARLFLIMSG
jgi:hypothetical protein